MEKRMIGMIMVLVLALVLVSGCGGSNNKTVDVTTPTNLLTDGGFETEGAAGVTSLDATTTWFNDNSGVGTLVTDTVHGGTYACLVTRTFTYSAASTDITSILNTNGPGTYRIQFYAKLGAGSAGDSIQPVISLFTPDWAGHYPSGSNPLTDVNSTDWTLVTGDIDLTWASGSLTKAYLSFATSTTTDPVYIDDFSMIKVN
jgi:Carbohydrate binding domain.